MTEKTGNENFTSKGIPKDFILQDFWRWCASDLLDNTLRGTLAEFIVAKALGIEAPQENWSAYDLKLDNWKIEVKAAAYVQSWSQKKPSTITYSIRPTRAWTSKGGRSDIVKRQSDIYIFCLLSEKDKEKVNPLDLDQWDFYPVLTSILTEKLSNQGTIALSVLQKICNNKCNYESLYSIVTSMLNQ